MGLSFHGGQATFLAILRGEIQWPLRRTADMNCDGKVDDADAEPFFLAVTDINA